MSLIIEDCKGHVHLVGAGTGGRSAGFYKISPAIEEVEGSKALILGIPLSFQEIVQPSVTLDDKKTLYVFGTAWNQASIQGVLLLGPASTKGQQVEKLINWYETNRVSRLKGPIELSLGTAGVSAYVTGLRLDAADPQFNKQAFTIILLTSEIKSEG